MTSCSRTAGTCRILSICIIASLSLKQDPSAPKQKQEAEETVLPFDLL